MFAIEKRCISAEEHREQYPGSEVVMDGCGDAWSGYVQYCVCASDYCNMKNLTVQQMAAGIVPKDQTPSPSPSVPVPTTATVAHVQKETRAYNLPTKPPSVRENLLHSGTATETAGNVPAHGERPKEPETPRRPGISESVERNRISNIPSRSFGRKPKDRSDRRTGGNKSRSSSAQFLQLSSLLLFPTFAQLFR